MARFDALPFDLIEYLSRILFSSARKDLSSLSMVNRQFRAQLTPTLFQHIAFPWRLIDAASLIGKLRTIVDRDVYHVDAILKNQAIRRAVRKYRIFNLSNDPRVPRRVWELVALLPNLDFLDLYIPYPKLQELFQKYPLIPTDPTGATLPSVRQLSIPTPGSIHLLGKCPELEILHIMPSPSETERTIPPEFAASLASAAPHLKQLHLWSEVETAALEELAKSHPRLEQLGVRHIGSQQTFLNLIPVYRQFRNLRVLLVSGRFSWTKVFQAPPGGRVSLQELEKMGLQEAMLARDLLYPLAHGLVLHKDSRTLVVKIALRIRIVKGVPAPSEERMVTQFIEATFDGSALSWATEH